MIELVKNDTVLDDTKRAKLIAIITKMLTMQKVNTKAHPIIDHNYHVNRKAIGYICGFINAGVETAGQDFRNSEIIIPVTFEVLRNLFPGHETTLLEFLVAAARSRDEAVRVAMEIGGGEFVECAESPDKTPNGFMRFMEEGDNTGPLN